MQQPMRILLADDHEAVRRSLCAILKLRVEVCAEASNGREAVERARTVRADVVLLDLRMPELNGLDAAREILRERPGTRVLLLTVQPSDELALEARNIGIDAVVQKSDADTLTALLARMEPQAMRLAGSEVGTARHIGAFFESDDARYRIVAPFLAEGLDRGEKVFHIVNRTDDAARAKRLTEAGIDLPYALQRGRLELLSWDELYFPGGRFDQHATLKHIHDLLAGSAAAGFPATRWVANMEWAANGRPGAEALVELESRVNLSLEANADVVTCAYDLARFDARLIVDVMRAHPALVVGGALFENPFYVAPDRLLSELAGRRADS